ncbi:class I SAM-dependent methyltransferase [Sulfuritalea sp.]|uniref:class I SAM-dependent methyltransferase n=1 Tax=Sulfuritalea sp. TaxID=2480090 RepID=UPI001ACA04E5|nr:class I SAM-dependent methyltransferase [Sulfuritalea sp.]MBN8473923.1 class I SAM-dependent methyltransferase [Sulfuritalea sp.]
MKTTLCRIAGTPLTTVVDFGRQPLGNGFLEPHQFSGEYFFPMEAGFSEASMMFQLIEQPDPEKMFHDHYAFYSSTSNYMARHFKEFADQVLRSGYLVKDDPFVVELGCNDGIMLKNFAAQNLRHLGIEPSLNVAREANKHGVRTCSEFFTEQLAESIVAEHGQADAFLAANVMCHIPDITGVVRGIKKLLKPTGVVMFEDPYLGDVVAKTSYDQIYDEHVFLFSALSIRYLFGLHEMELIDVQPQTTHGGSMRYVLAHRGAYPVGDSVVRLVAGEQEQGLDRLATFESFRASVEESRTKLVSLLRDLKARGKKVAGYGATSKSTTILNYCGIGPDLIAYISDTTPIKQGKCTPGMHIPVVPYQTFKEDPPDYAVLFAWNHAEEIMAKERDFMASGGKWIVHVPEVRVL